ALLRGPPQSHSVSVIINYFNRIIFHLLISLTSRRLVLTLSSQLSFTLDRLLLSISPNTVNCVEISARSVYLNHFQRQSYDKPDSLTHYDTLNYIKKMAQVACIKKKSSYKMNLPYNIEKKLIVLKDASDKISC
ncbi:hypothetical protein L9F63_016557, partial [Diploptera punctata]